MILCAIVNSQLILLLINFQNSPTIRSKEKKKKKIYIYVYIYIFACSQDDKILIIRTLYYIYIKKKLYREI